MALVVAASEQFSPPMILQPLGADIDEVNRSESGWQDQFILNPVDPFAFGGARRVRAPSRRRRSRSAAAPEAAPASRSELSDDIDVAAKVAMIDLITSAKRDSSRNVLVKSVGSLNAQAILSGPVARNIVSQGALGVCGAASVAGALNACYEGIAGVPSIDWPEILYNHFRDKLGINILGRKNGRPVATTKHVGNKHVLQVVRSFPHMQAEVLVDKSLASRPSAAWKALTHALQQPRSAVWFHTTNHYVLVQGCVGMTGTAYDDQCAIFSSSAGQEAFEMISFQHACNVIRKSKGGYKMFRFFYDGPERTDAEEEWAAYGNSTIPGLMGDCSDCVHSSAIADENDEDDAAEDEEEERSLQDVDEPAPDHECAVCLEIFCEPLRLPCEHAFCRSCLIRIPHRRCPLCRAEHPASFDPFGAAVDTAIQQQLERQRPQEYAMRLADAAQLAKRLVRLKVGNRHQFVENPARSRNGRNVNRHRWTAYVELKLDQAMRGKRIEDFVEKVLFKLAPYYTSWPSSDTNSVRVGRNPEVRQAPFEVTRVGWGMFPVKIVIHWKASLKMNPLEVEHELSFDDGGSFSTQCAEFATAGASVDMAPTSSRSTPWPTQAQSIVQSQADQSNRRTSSSPLQNSGQSSDTGRNTRQSNPRASSSPRHDIRHNSRTRSTNVSSPVSLPPPAPASRVLPSPPRAQSVDQVRRRAALPPLPSASSARAASPAAVRSASPASSTPSPSSAVAERQAQASRAASSATPLSGSSTSSSNSWPARAELAVDDFDDYSMQVTNRSSWPARAELAVDDSDNGSIHVSSGRAWPARAELAVDDFDNASIQVSTRRRSTPSAQLGSRMSSMLPSPWLRSRGDTTLVADAAVQLRIGNRYQEEFEHELCFDTGGKSSVHTVRLDMNSVRVASRATE